METNIDETTKLYSTLYDNEDFTEFIENKYNIKDNEIVPIYLENLDKYIEFLVHSRQPQNKDEFIEKSYKILSNKAENKFWLKPSEVCFEEIIEMIKNEEISSEDIEYIISKSKFYKGFRLFLISTFSNRKNSKTQRNWSELDPIIADLISRHFNDQLQKQ